jgi:ABC-type nitrate/sulfonate/bicarbonate transport system substrate-binding protein
MLGRRLFIAATTAATAAPCRAQTATPVTVLTPFGFIIDFLEMMNAVTGGHFQAAGLDATLLGAGGAAASTQQLAAGRCQFIRGSCIDVMKAMSAQQDVSLVSVATIFQGSNFNVISSTAKPIASAEDFRGRRIGVVSIGGTTENFLDLMLKQANIDKAAVPREVVGNNPGSFALLRQGRIDGFIATSNVVDLLRQQNAPVLAWSTDRYAPMPGQSYFTTRRIIDENPAMVQAFVKAMKASADEIVKGPIEPVLDRAAARFDIPGLRDKPALVATMQGDVALWLSEGPRNLMRNIPALWQSARDSLAAAGLADIADATTLYTNRFIDAATQA